MIRIFATIGLTGFLAACAPGNPFFPVAVVEDKADTSVSNLYATATHDDMTMNALRYDDNGTPGDTSDDVLLINNLPFDGTDGTSGGYARMAGGALPGSFEVYESPVTAERRYFAVFRRTANSQVAAAGTGDYLEFGYGGATAQRLSGSTLLPANGEYTYTGEYAAVRITTLTGGRDDVEYITGQATMLVDITDFDITGAVEGTINNRFLYDSYGTLIGGLDDFVTLATADIDFDNKLTLSSTATGYDTTQLTSGKWQSIFTGPNGEEIAGFVFLEGNVAAGADDDIVRETGVFIALR